MNQYIQEIQITKRNAMFKIKYNAWKNKISSKLLWHEVVL